MIECVNQWPALICPLPRLLVKDEVLLAQIRCFVGGDAKMEKMLELIQPEASHFNGVE